MIALKLSCCETKKPELAVFSLSSLRIRVAHALIAVIITLHHTHPCSLIFSWNAVVQGSLKRE